ncbi:hypothetical protein DH2020_020954 [Rehmannia glutinosa]|uniref:Uncharacterized protein n=1 Tax=Rehmannia glutinosa TaxID=99300 RepID=A0ABR0WCT9_REHGL
MSDIGEWSRGKGLVDEVGELVTPQGVLGEEGRSDVAPGRRRGIWAKKRGGVVEGAEERRPGARQVEGARQQTLVHLRRLVRTGYQLRHLVLIASNRAAIEIGMMKELWDASGIQVYQINKQYIYHLNPNPNPKRILGGPSYPKCETCRRNLMKDSNDSFCSIACKTLVRKGHLHRPVGGRLSTRYQSGARLRLQDQGLDIWGSREG